MLVRSDLDIGTDRMGVDILDQPQPAKGCKSEEAYNPVREYIHREILNRVFPERMLLAGATLTINESHLKDQDETMLHRYIRQRLASSTIWKKMNYILFPEFGKKGRLHYHAVYWDEYQVVVMKSIKWWRRNYGYAKPECELRHPDKWKQYCAKDYGKTGLGCIYNLISKH